MWKLHTWFDKDCKQAQNQVRKLGKQKHSSPQDSLLREKYHEKLKEYKRTCKSKKYFYTQDSLNKINSALDDPTSFWKMWKKFDDGGTEKTKLEIPGEKLFSHYSQLHNQNQNDDVPEPEPFKKTTDNVKFNKHFSKKEFMLVIKYLKNNKSEGYDCISNEMIKNSPDIILDLIYKFMNLCFEKSLIPNSWAYELISLIHKKGSKCDLNNYRGICVSSALLKILCTLLNNRLQDHCSSNEILSKNQIGFKKNCRTSDHILTLKNLVKKYVTHGQKKLYTCFVDFEKAFDSVWHKGLFKKLENYGIKGKTLNLITDLYRKTQCSIKIQNNITNFFKYEKGVRQGCPLSPILFNLYINDLIEIINRNYTSKYY